MCLFYRHFLTNVFQENFNMIVFLKAVAVIAVSYILGSVSAAVIVSKFFFKEDVRTQGSCNAGTTNMARVFGMSAGLITLVFDILKAVISMAFGRLLLGDAGFAISAVFCMVGHCWPVFFNFKGGKGVAVSAGIAIMLGWQYVVSLIGIFLIIAVATRYVSLGSLVGILLLTPALYIFGCRSPWYYGMAIILTVIVWYMHRGNIKRLLSGTESKFTPGKRKKQ